MEQHHHLEFGVFLGVLAFIQFVSGHYHFVILSLLETNLFDLFSSEFMIFNKLVFKQVAQLAPQRQHVRVLDNCLFEGAPDIIIGLRLRLPTEVFRRRQVLCQLIKGVVVREEVLSHLLIDLRIKIACYFVLLFEHC